MVGHPSVLGRSSFGHWSVICRSLVGHMSVICRSYVGHMSVICRHPSVILRSSFGPSFVHWSVICRSSFGHWSGGHWMDPTQNKVYSICYSQAVTQPSTNQTRAGLTSVFGREPVLSWWCGRRQGVRLRATLSIVLANRWQVPTWVAPCTSSTWTGGKSVPASLLGLLAKIKCSICSYQLNI